MVETQRVTVDVPYIGQGPLVADADAEAEETAHRGSIPSGTGVAFVADIIREQSHGPDIRASSDPSGTAAVAVAGVNIEVIAGDSDHYVGNDQEITEVPCVI